MKIGIYCFSGTGNTRKVAKEFQRCLCQEGQEVGFFDIEKAEHDITALDLLVIAYPVHAFNAPEPVLELADSLHPARPLPLVIIKTSGEPLRLNNSSSQRLVRLLREKNIHLTAECWYVMPYNIMFRHSDGMAWRMWKTAEERIAEDARWVANGGSRLPRQCLSSRIASCLFFIEQWGARFNGRFFKVSPECDGCLRCVKACPRGNLRFEDGKLKAGKRCVLCMRCAMYCPRNAIRAGLLNAWKVNGPYNFVQAEEDRPIRYCRRAYEKYFNGTS